MVYGLHSLVRGYAMKYAESEEINGTTVDYCLGSVECIQIFVSLMGNEWKLSHSGQLGYLNAIYDLMDYRK